MVVNLIFNDRDQEEGFSFRSRKTKKEKLSIRNKSKLNRIELLFFAISIIAAFIALSTLIYIYIEHTSERTFGERLVLNHFRLNTPLYDFHFKPITIIVIFAFISWAFGLEAQYNYFSSRSLLFKRTMVIFFFTVVFIFFFEVFQNFMFWYATYVINLGKIEVDILHTNLTPGGLIVNFTAMTKFFTFIFFWGLYGLYFFSRTMKTDSNSQKLKERNNV